MKQEIKELIQEIDELKNKQSVEINSINDMERACQLKKADMNLSMFKIADLLNQEGRTTRLNKKYCGNNLAAGMIKWLGNNPDKAKAEYRELFLKLASSKTMKNIIITNGFSELFIELGGKLD